MSVDGVTVGVADGEVRQPGRRAELHDVARFGTRSAGNETQRGKNRVEQIRPQVTHRVAGQWRHEDAGSFERQHDEPDAIDAVLTRSTAKAEGNTDELPRRRRDPPCRQDELVG